METGLVNQRSESLQLDADWPLTELGEVVDLLTGFPFKSDQFVTNLSAPRLLRGDNIVQGSLRWDGVKRWRTSATTGYEKYWLREDDVVLAMDRPWIEAGLKYASIRRSEVPTLLVQRVARLRGTRTLDSRFLKFLIGSPQFTQHVLAVQTGTAVPHISGSQIRSFRFRLPPIETQLSIAHILSTLDDKIELNRQMNQTLEQIAAALFRSWFVDFDPVRAKAAGRQPAGMDAETAALFPDRLVDSEMGEIPEGWQAGSLGDIAAAKREIVNPSDVSAETPYFGLEHLPRQSIALSEWGRAGSITSAKTKFQQGDILFGRLRPYFHKVGVAPVDGLCSTDILVIGPPCQAFFGPVLGFSSSPEVIQYSDQGSEGTRMPRVSWQYLSQYPIAVPPRPVAAAFTNIVNPMINRIHANIFESHTLAKLRDTLLPRLLSGELRVRSTSSIRRPSPCLPRPNRPSCRAASDGRRRLHRVGR